MNRLVVILLGLLILGGIAVSSMFTVDERHHAIRFKLGEIVRSDYDAGLHFKVPFINNVLYFDKRLLTLDKQPERFLTSEKKNLMVDFFVKWRIADPAVYYRATGGEESRAMQRLEQIVKDGLRSEFGKRTIKEAVSGERSEIMELLRVKAQAGAVELGVEVADVRIKRIDLPAQVSESVYQRMKTERERIAKDLRAQGSEAAEKIRANADRQVEIELANGFKQAETLRGEGDAKAAGIYAEAYNRDKEFYSFYRSLQAYQQMIANGGDMLVLEPDSDFFKYFADPHGGKAKP